MDSSQSLVGFKGYDRCTGWIQTNLSLAPEDTAASQVRFKPIPSQLVKIQQPHRSDSNQGLSTIAICPFISGLLGQKFKILKVDSVENLCFELNQDLDDDHKQKEF